MASTARREHVARRPTMSMPSPSTTAAVASSASAGDARSSPASQQPSYKPESATAWQLIREHVFDRILDNAELEQLIQDRAKMSAEPHADLIRLMLGTNLSEENAKSMWVRALEHRRALSRALGRAVHVRVAALDLLTLQPGLSAPSSSASSSSSSSSSSREKEKQKRDSRPIMVASSVLERALEEASSDGVTGLPRGSHFMNLLEYELLQRRRRVTVVFIDLDGMKSVNDAHGHARGDDVLRTMAEAARSVLRRGDVVARLGGDEFGLMLVDATPEEATLAVDRLRDAFEQLTAEVATSFSAGIAIASDGSTAEELLREADRAMYVEKRQRSTRRIANTIPSR